MADWTNSTPCDRVVPIPTLGFLSVAPIASLMSLLSPYALFFNWLLKWGQVLGALGSLILSGLLVWLYYQQYELLKIEQTPSLEVSDWEMNGDEITLYLSNFGEGLAKNLRLRTTVEFPTEDDVNMVSDSRNRDSVVVVTVEHNIHRYEEGEKLRERDIMGTERKVEFRGEPPFPDPNGQGYGNFQSGVGESLRQEAYEFCFWIDVVYETEFGEEKSEPVTVPGRWFDIEPEEGKELFQTRPNEITCEYSFNKSALASSRPDE